MGSSLKKVFKHLVSHLTVAESTVGAAVIKISVIHD